MIVVYIVLTDQYLVRQFRKIKVVVKVRSFVGAIVPLVPARGLYHLNDKTPNRFNDLNALIYPPQTQKIPNKNVI